MNSFGSSGKLPVFFSIADPQDISVKTFYRFKLVSGVHIKYSNILNVSNLNSSLEMINLINPFVSKISFQLNTSNTEEVQMQLLDAVGHLLINKKAKGN